MLQAASRLKLQRILAIIIAVVRQQKHLIGLREAP